MKKVSLAMIVKNEEKYIERCIESVKHLVDEIVIVDTGSSDNTISILSRYPNLYLYSFDWCDNFSQARNYAIDKCNSDYILSLDADEYVIKGSREDLEEIMNLESIGQIVVQSSFRQDDQIHYSNSNISRFFPSDIRYSGIIHEQLDSNLPRTRMNFSVKHDGYFEVDKSKRNIPLLIKELNKNPNDPYLLYQLGKEYRIMKQYKKALPLFKKSYNQINNKVSYYGRLVVEIIDCGKELPDKDVIKVIEENERVLDYISDFHFNKGLFYLNFCLKFPQDANNYLIKIRDSFLKCLSINGNSYNEYVQGTSSFLAEYNLGVFFEVIGDIKLAKEYYLLSFKHGYKNAEERLKSL